MNRILLLFDHRENCRLLAEWLRPRYQVVLPQEESLTSAEAVLAQSFDLCIVGPRALDRLNSHIQTRRTAEQPVLLPVMLATNRQDVNYATRHLWQSVDELIIQPIEKVELQARVEILLRSRQLSLELQACRSETGLQIVARQTAESKRDQAITAQRIKDEEYRSLFRSMSEALLLCEMILDEDGNPADVRILEANSANESMTGLPLEHMVGNTLRSFVPNIEEWWFPAYHRVVLTGEPFRQENYVADFDSWFDTYVYKIGYADDNTFAIIYRNISDRKATELEIQRLNQKLSRRVNELQAILDAAPVGIAISKDAECKDIRVNQFAQSMLGVAPNKNVSASSDQAASRPFREYRHGQPISPEELPMQIATSQGIEVRGAEIQMVREDGLTLDWWINALPIFDDHGVVQGSVAAIVDVTELKQTEAALRQSNDRYQTLFASVDEGFCIIKVLFDADNAPIDYLFLEVNPAFEQQTGLSDAAGKTAKQLVPNLENRWVEIYGNVAQTGEPIHFEDSAAAMDRWFDVYACRIGQPEKHQVALLFKDISDRKRSEAERDQLLQSEQAARSAAERANQIKDEFLAVLSHELRTPMGPILGWAQLLQRGNLDAEKTKAALETIDRNAKLQVQLIDDLLDISRILQAKLSLNLFPLDLTFIITAAIDTVRLSLDAKAIQLDTIFKPEPIQVRGDSSRLQQVFWNLLSNAAKFTPQGGRVEVRLEEVEEMRSYGDEEMRSEEIKDTPHPPIPSSPTHAQITVTDTGKGIHPDFLPYVFEHFRQEDGATTRKFGGLGLGLAIARQIIEMHGGTISVNSPGEGQGATFTVRLPLLETEDRRQRAEGSGGDEARKSKGVGSDLSLSSSPHRLIPLSPLAGLQVLVVDDDADSREFVRFLLQQEGAVVTLVASGKEALEQFAQSPPSLLISDIGMPEMDGYMLMRQIRALPMQQAKTVIAIALTAYAGEADGQQAQAAGFQKHLPKPLDPVLGIKTIVELVQSINRQP
jgi:signal transduction histidine kinase/DNA-binding response OmpR family regulator